MCGSMRRCCAWKERTGIAITDGIGSTEMMHIFVSAAGDDVRPGSTVVTDGLKGFEDLQTAAVTHVLSSAISCTTI